MKLSLFLTIMMSLFLSACQINEHSKKAQSSQENSNPYFQSLEQENNVRYIGVTYNPGAYIPPMCYTRTKDENGRVYNPCYSCHTQGKVPNYYNDANLQKEYSFPPIMLKNPYTNLFEDYREDIAQIGDDEILAYIREDNYHTQTNGIRLAEELPNSWKGYRPDCYFNFNEQGFDHNSQGKLSGWRAFRYYPFLGTFWPTNGSFDDVLIRLPEVFRQNQEEQFDLTIYKLNLSILEAVIKQKDIKLEAPINESLYGVDLNNDGQLDMAEKIIFRTEPSLAYTGKAGQLQKKGQIYLAPGLFPVGTEFLHTVRYLDWDEYNQRPTLAPRVKEVRYARKIQWFNYSELERIARSELYEAEINDSSQGTLAFFRGNFEEGMMNETGWVFQGFIEDHQGNLRPQTEEETLYCMGCHSHLGATTDSTFAFSRKLEGVTENGRHASWNHWSQKGLKGEPELQVHYAGKGKLYEYSFYLLNNPTGDELRNNKEVYQKFFDGAGNQREEAFEALHHDVSKLLLPSKSRLLELNKAYLTRVKKQNYIYGREINITPVDTLIRSVKENEETGIEFPIIQK